VCFWPFFSFEDEGDDYDKTLAVHNYLFGYEFSDTIIAFLRDPDTVLVIASKKKADLITTMAKDPHPVPIKTMSYQTSKSDKNEKNISTLIKMLQKSKNGVRGTKSHARSAREIQHAPGACRLTSFRACCCSCRMRRSASARSWTRASVRPRR